MAALDDRPRRGDDDQSSSTVRSFLEAERAGDGCSELSLRIPSWHAVLSDRAFDIDMFQNSMPTWPSPIDQRRGTPDAVCGTGHIGRALDRQTHLTEDSMKTKILAAAAATLVVGLAIPAQAATNVTTPGHKMQARGSLSGHPGASGYTPGHIMQQRGSKKGFPGASGYAPGRATTAGSGTVRR
jgi:hypothetical protein